jgi:SAM-dependent methyltransferase
MFSEGDGYEQFMGRWSRRLAPLFVDFAQVGADDVVLDVGSGTGALSLAVTAVGSAQVTGIERSESYVRHAQQHASSDRARFQIGDATALPFPDNTFDRALSMLVLNFVPAPAVALDQMIRVTRPGGVVASAVWDYGDGMGMLRMFWDEAVAQNPEAEPRDERHMPLCGRGALAELWRDHGLNGVDQQALTIEMAFSSFDDYWQPFLLGQGPAGAYVTSLSEFDRRALQSRLQRRWAAGLSFNARAWAVRGMVA